MHAGVATKKSTVAARKGGLKTLGAVPRSAWSRAEGPPGRRASGWLEGSRVGAGIDVAKAVGRHGGPVNRVDRHSLVGAMRRPELGRRLWQQQADRGGEE